MLSLIFLQFLVFTAYCDFSVINEVIKDPHAFAQTFSKANPAQIKEVIRIIQGLIDDGQAKKKGITDAYAAAAKLLEDANGDLAKALDEFETARGERKLADELVVDLEGKVQQKEDEESKALEAKNLAKQTFDDAQAWLDQENIRIDNEKKILKDVVKILRELANNGGRRLLSYPSHLAPILPALIESAKVNPDSLDKVVEMVITLINDGEAVRQDAENDRDLAKNVFEAKDAAWKAAVQATIDAKSLLGAAQKDAAAKLVVEKKKEAIWAKATAAQEAAQRDADEKLQIQNKEVPVIDHEDEELRKVIEILEKMIE